MRRLLALLLFALPLYGQSITNGSFETFAPLSNVTWSYGPVPNWTVTGTGGLWQPSTQYFPALPDGKQVLWLNNGSAVQDTGAPGAANANYTLTVYVDHRPDVSGNTYTVAMAVNGGIFCSTTGDSNLIPSGNWAPVVLKCPMGGVPTTGNLQVVLTSAGSQVAFDNVTLTSDAPLVITLPGMAVTFPMIAPPPCAPTDGLCIFSVRVCLVDGVTCMNASEGTLYLVKTSSATGEQAVVVAKAAKTP